MTAFSYIISIMRVRQLREPMLLNKLVDRLTGMYITPHSSNPQGWLLHFVVGAVFVVAYHFVWVLTDIDVSWQSAAIMGAISGIVGIAIWTVTFLLHPNPPKVHFLGFFSQLFFAHVIFGLGAWVGYIVPTL